MVDTSQWPTPKRASAADHERAEREFIAATYGSTTNPQIERDRTHCQTCGEPRESRQHAYDLAGPAHEFHSIYNRRFFNYRLTLPGFEFEHG